MSVRELQEYTYYSRYARFNKNESRRETWNEAVDRVMDMHLNKYPQLKEEIECVRLLVKEKRLLGSQRALQFGGEPILRKNARLYNCSASYCDRIRFFQEALWMLLCGSGVGFSVQRHHVAKLPEIQFLEAQESIWGGLHSRRYTIPDSIEGWADALGILLACYMPHPEFSDWLGCTVEFDYSKIRPAGSYLSSGVGKAPGPEPLRKALEKVRGLLNLLTNRGQKQLRPIDAYDVVMHASDAVLSGGVRRSATLCLFSPDDEEMITAKTGNWFYENPQRARSNNSALLLRNETTRESFMKLMTYVKEFGEPGFIWAEDAEALFNPCVEIGLFAYDIETGETGWQVCNLCEINGKKIKSKDDFELAARGAAILGTIQAGYTDFEYLGETSEKIIRRESLLGVSITGMMDSPEIIFNEDIQKEMAKLVIKTNEWMAEKMGINPAARTTCVKPAGTTSCILGSSSGIHPHHAKRYFRRVQGNALEPILQHFRSFNPLAIEKSVWSANNTDEVITFCVEVQDGITKNQMPALTLLERVQLTQRNWVNFGKIKERCIKPWLTHNVSNTINVRPDEWDSVADYIFKNRKWFAGISLIPQSGDLDYQQAPFVTVHTPRELLQMYGDGVLLVSGLIVDGLYAFNDNLWIACDAVLGLGSPLAEPKRPGNGDISIDDYRQWEEDHRKWELKLDWIRRVKQFSERYCENDIKKCTYLMKEVSNWKKWLDLQREYKVVDYSILVEHEDATTPMQTIACSGGKCDII